MDVKRKPFQGVFNIIRFNRHFYLGAILVIISIFVFNQFIPEQIQPLAFWLTILASLTMLISLFVSYFVYDLSDFYQINWLSKVGSKSILNINAGFDETSEIIKNKFPKATLTICDFYDPEKHTEVSIQRARLAYPPIPGTIQVKTNELPFPDSSFDYSLAILSAHEIRNENERIDFFHELNRVTKPSGKIIVTEHLRDLNNFMAYTIGFFHFHSGSTWMRTFEQANLKIEQEIKTSAFITTFVLKKNGNTL